MTSAAGFTTTAVCYDTCVSFSNENKLQLTSLDFHFSSSLRVYISSPNKNLSLLPCKSSGWARGLIYLLISLLSVSLFAPLCRVCFLSSEVRKGSSHLSTVHLFLQYVPNISTFELTGKNVHQPCSFTGSETWLSWVYCFVNWGGDCLSDELEELTSTTNEQKPDYHLNTGITVIEKYEALPPISWPITGQCGKCLATDTQPPTWSDVGKVHEKGVSEAIWQYDKQFARNVKPAY